MERRVVLLIGCAETNLAEALRTRGLSPASYDNIRLAYATRGSAPRDGSRSLFVMIGRNQKGEPDRAGLMGSLRYSVRASMDAGLNVAIIANGAPQAAAAQSVLAQFQPRHDSTRIRVFDISKGSDPSVEFAARHDPGPDAVPMVIRGITGASHQTLLQRAFHDFSEIEATQLEGGHSRALGVWRIDALDRINRFSCEAFVVKIGSVAPITREINNYLNWADFRIPFPHRAPLALSRCVQGFQHRAIVSMFVGRAVRFDDYVCQVSPAMAIAALFDGPLRTWRSRTRLEHIALGQQYKQYGRFTGIYLKHLYDKWNDANVPDPMAVYSALEALPPQPVNVCHSHGDLHVRNLYVRENASEVILIDFASANGDSPAARDPACLDVSLAFDCKTGKLGDHDLAHIYRQNALTVLPDASKDGRLSAIRQLRIQAAASCNSALEYDITLAIYLLLAARRHASKAAYAAAVGILQSNEIL